MQTVVTIEATGGNTTGIRAARIIDELDAGQRPRIKVVFPNGHELRTRMGSHDSEPFIPVSAATRKEAEVAAALAEAPAANDFFDGLTASQQKGFHDLRDVRQAARDETGPGSQGGHRPGARAEAPVSNLLPTE